MPEPTKFRGLESDRGTVHLQCSAVARFVVPPVPIDPRTPTHQPKCLRQIVRRIMIDGKKAYPLD
jgi:hypothetical protein